MTSSKWQKWVLALVYSLLFKLWTLVNIAMLPLLHVLKALSQCAIFCCGGPQGVENKSTVTLTMRVQRRPLHFLLVRHVSLLCLSRWWLSTEPGEDQGPGKRVGSWKFKGSWLVPRKQGERFWQDFTWVWKNCINHYIQWSNQCSAWPQLWALSVSPSRMPPFFKILSHNGIF